MNVNDRVVFRYTYGDARLIGKRGKVINITNEKCKMCGGANGERFAVVKMDNGELVEVYTKHLGLI